MEEGREKRKDMFLPASIIIAALLVSVSLIYSSVKKPDVKDVKEVVNNNLQGNLENAFSPEKIRPVNNEDHVFGDVNAPIKIIEFSDLECPFCKRFHPVLKQALQEYNGKVAWVYRHYPLDVLHSKARKESEASECAAKLGGNDAFWKFIDKIYEITPSNNGLDPAELPKVAEGIGLNVKDFETCLASGEMAERVARDVEDAQASGGEGTPYSVVVAVNGKKFVIPGALPYEPAPGRPEYEGVKPIIESALSEK